VDNYPGAPTTAFRPRSRNGLLFSYFFLNCFYFFLYTIYDFFVHTSIVIAHMLRPAADIAATTIIIIISLRGGDWRGLEGWLVEHTAR
jgi:hypothetical protein